MGVIFALLVFVGLAAIIVWVADWTSVGARPTAVDILNRRLARGEIDRAVRGRSVRGGVIGMESTSSTCNKPLP